MAKSLDEKMAELTPERRKRIHRRVDELIQQETLRGLRKLRQLSQEQVAHRMGIRQENISRMENRDDLRLSTLNQYVQALGGELSLVVHFPDHPPIQLSHRVAELNQEDFFEEV